MRKVKLLINSKEYILEYNRESIKWLESMGFDVEQFYRKPVTYREILWQGLFLKNHKDVNPNLALKLMDTYAEEKGEIMVNKVVKFAFEEYTSFINALAGMNSEKKEEELEIISQ